MKRFGSATRNGGLREGKGSVSTEISHAFEICPCTFFGRYVEKPGANLEELIGPAHAARLLMSFVGRLSVVNFLANRKS